MPNRYEELASLLVKNIDKGIYRPGDRLPGIRQTSQSEGVSPSTVVAAYRQMELEGYIEAKPRSGFYISNRATTHLQEPHTSKPTNKPRLVKGQEQVLLLAQNSIQPNAINLGTAIPDPSYLPTQALNRSLSTLSKKNRFQINSYEFPPGLPKLRQEIAKRLALAGCSFCEEDIVITNGCQEAIFLSLKTVTKPGDIVAVESPTYHGLLQVIDALNLKALEIPTHPRDGISIEALQLALEQWPIKACVVIPNFSNPLGSLMSNENKKQLVKLINQHSGVTLIEDDIYGELSFSGKRPLALKSFDSKNNIIYCSSVSKTLSPGLRIGWAASEKFREELSYQKYVTNTSSPTLNQMVAEEFFSSGRYGRHLKGLRTVLMRNSQRMITTIGKYFPNQTKITRPEGGYVLWLELPAKTDTEQLQAAALKQRISIAPGAMFSLSNKYKNCMRLSYALPWSDNIEKAIQNLGKLVAGKR